MASQFFGLNIAYSALVNNNAALNTTTNNIANVHTKGYSRQHVVQQANDPIRMFETYGCAGAGVDTLAIERYRDEFYDSKYWDNETKVGQYETKEYYMTQLETYFADDGTTGFQSVFNDFMDTTLSELIKDPSSSSVRSHFVGSASAMTQYFNELSENLSILQNSINQEIKLKVDELNSISGEIANLSLQINTIELSGPTANELRDRRGLLVDQLSKIVDVEVKETPVMDNNNAERETGATRFVVKIAGGQVLTDGSDYHELVCVGRTNEEKVNQTDVAGLYDLYWDYGAQFNLYSSAIGGELQGLIHMRDGNNSESFTGQVTAMGKSTDGSNKDTVTIAVTKDFLQDLNKCNLSDSGGKISFENREFYYDSWEFQTFFDAQGKQQVQYTFTISDDPELNPERVTNFLVGKKAAVGNSVPYQGIPYYGKQMNEWIRTFSKKANDILTAGYNLYDTPGLNLFTGTANTDNDQYELPDSTDYDVEALIAQQSKALMDADPTLTEEAAILAAKQTISISVSSSDDSYYRMSAKTFAVRTALINDVGLLGAAKNPVSAEGAEQSQMLSQLKSMANDKSRMSFRGASASEFLQCVLSDVALNTSQAQNFAKRYTDLSNTIDTQRISISGVDEDEEAVNLVKYQNGYNLASRMIQTLSEIYDRLILETGV
ncbi:MAG: flagellar hook-associated protein FlgK [Lachnospiraceae bacterium]|jgi:flagellar hook-associated protein 1 FlgK|nr:flagellar hook-associated protein FlgK [Lachnospiraceae bacterium]